MSKKRGKTPYEQRYAGLPLMLLHHRNYTRLSYPAKALLTDLCMQFNGYNNGNIIATWSHMEQRGWRSKETLNLALQELLHYGFIHCTRKGKRIGGAHHPSLYALGWEPVHDCGKGFSATLRPSNGWKQEHEPWSRPRRPRHSAPNPEKTQGRQPYRPTTVAVLDQVRQAN